jgi:dihydroorotase
MMKAGFRPDSISTDWTIASRETPGVVDLPNVMSKFLPFGMTVPEVIAQVTCNPARMFPVFKGRGTLGVGAPADVTVLDLRSGDYDFLDNFDNKKRAGQRFFPSATVVGGKLFSRA